MPVEFSCRRLQVEKEWNKAELAGKFPPSLNCANGRVTLGEDFNVFGAAPVAGKQVKWIYLMQMKLVN